jgi:uncharacterized protein (TIGR02284 family)
MSTDEAVSKDLLETLEDGAEGYTKGAEKLSGDGHNDVAATFRTFAGQRRQFSSELRTMAKQYGDEIHESGSLAASLHRGWMGLKDALSGSSAKAILDSAEQGEDHAVKAYDEALRKEISPELRTVVERQYADIKTAHDTVRALTTTHR